MEKAASEYENVATPGALRVKNLMGTKPLRSNKAGVLQDPAEEWRRYPAKAQQGVFLDLGASGLLLTEMMHEKLPRCSAHFSLLLQRCK